MGRIGDIIPFRGLLHLAALRTIGSVTLAEDARLKSAIVTNYLSVMGIACFLAGVEKLTPDNPFKGAMVETYVAQNLVSIIHSTWPRANIFFWNIQGRHEVDFVIEAGNKCIAIEIKSAARWEHSDLTSLKSFIAATPHCIAGILAYNGTTPVCLGDKLWAIPISILLQ